MVQCPRCHNVVDERTTAACPHCAMPLNAQAINEPPAGQMPPAGMMPPQYGNAMSGGNPGTPQPGMPPAPRGNTRVSLTGEVIESSAPQPGGLYGNTQAGMSPPTAPGRPMPAGAVRPPAAAYPRREAEPDNSRRNALVINLSVAVVVLLLCVGGGGWYWTHRTNPKAQVGRYVHAIQWLDWGVVWDLSATPPGDKSRREFISEMNSKFDDNPLYKISARHKMEEIKFDVGEPTFQGSDATVSVTRAASGIIPSETIPLTLTNYGGIWKIHPPSANPLELIRGKKDEDEKLPNGGLPGGAGGAGGLPIPPGVGGMGFP